MQIYRFLHLHIRVRPYCPNFHERTKHTQGVGCTSKLLLIWISAGFWYQNYNHLEFEFLPHITIFFSWTLDLLFWNYWYNERIVRYQNLVSQGFLISATDRMLYFEWVSFVPGQILLPKIILRHLFWGTWKPFNLSLSVDLQNKFPKW